MFWKHSDLGFTNIRILKIAERVVFQRKYVCASVTLGSLICQEKYVCFGNIRIFDLQTLGS